MIARHFIKYFAYTVLLLGPLFSLHGQNQNLQVVLDSTFTNLKIGQAFAVTGRVQGNGLDVVPGGQIIKATVEFVSPDGMIVQTHEQTWDGFPQSGNPGTLRSPGRTSEIIFQFPWTQAQKSTEGWEIRARVEGAALELDLSDNVASVGNITMDLPNLVVNSLNISSSSGNNLYLPSSVLSVTGAVRNSSDTRTQEGVFFPLVARLYRGQNTTGANFVESETLILPSATPGGLTVIGANADATYEIKNLHLPDDAAPGETFTVAVTIDPSNVGFEDIVFETNENDNSISQTFTITDNANTRARLSVSQESFEGDVGPFNGLDPVRMAFTVRNIGLLPVQGTGNDLDSFTLRVVLSKDITFDNQDFILREFDFSGNALGAGLLPNESVTLDWIQQLPDNFEGDFYYLVNIQGDNQTTVDFPLENTPSLSLTAKYKGSTELLEGTTSTNNQGGERPSSSRDGRLIAYEKTVNGIQQIYYRDLVTGGVPVLVSQNYLPFNNGGGNGSSHKPKVSSDGSTIVFHSSASDIVPGDFNKHNDVFLYRVDSQELVRAYNFTTGNESNGPSYNPDVNDDGSVVVFESEATNLLSNKETTSGRQILVWNTKLGDNSTISAVTSGNGESKTPSIDGTGKVVVFASDATDIPFIVGKNVYQENNTTDSNYSNEYTDVFLHYLETNQTYLVNINNFTLQASDGPSDQPVISGDGTMIVYRSFASNLVEKKGISMVEVINGGVGYFGNPTLRVRDGKPSENQTGSGAVLRFDTFGIDQTYGQILTDGVRIFDHGVKYIDPIIDVNPDPNYPTPSETAEIKAFLSNPQGEIYLISTSDLTNPNMPIYSYRISENLAEVGGIRESREPSISYDGKHVAFSTKASNFLDTNLTRADGSIFYNTPNNSAQAQAVLIGGIGEIEVENPGFGYQSGFMLITDSSGSGSGAVASYEVDTFGRISSISMINSGSDYQLESTEITVENPRGGSGFTAGSIRFDGGGRIQRVEMTENGSGYHQIARSSLGKSGLITLDGDGVDENFDGIPDAKINSNRIFVDENGTGGIFLEQVVELELLSRIGLLNTELTFTDYLQNPLKIDFALSPQPNSSLSTISITSGTTNKTLYAIAEEITILLLKHWSSPDSNDRFQGPSIVGPNPGSSSFTFSALSGKVESNNPASVRIDYSSNMLIKGNGFTRVTPTISPAPVIHGYSEVLSQTTLTNQNPLSGLSNARTYYQPVIDEITDDIYLYSADSGKLERVSKSSFGMPANYLPTSTTAMPSSRFPALSGDGRHIFFSSDASGRGGLTFTGSNQSPDDGNVIRDVYHHDRKTGSLTTENIVISMLYPNKEILHGFAQQSNLPVIIEVDYNGSDLNFIALFIDEQFSGFLAPAESSYQTRRFTGSFNGGDPGTHVVRAIAFNNNIEEIGSSVPVQYFITPLQGQNPSINFEELPFSIITNTSVLPISSGGSDSDGTIEGIQYYVDGQKYGNEILRAPGVPQDTQSFSTDLMFSSTGVRSILAVVRDNSGNFVASTVQNLSIAPGSTPANIQFASADSNYTISNSDLDFNLTSGSISALKLKTPIGANFLGTPRVDVLGDGENAEITAVVDHDVNSLNYGKVLDLAIVNGGSGYTSTSTSFNVIPVVRSIGNGTPADIDILVATDFNQTTQQNDFRTNTVQLAQNVDGSSRSGSGYVISPRLRLPPFGFYLFNGQSYERLPLANPQGTTSRVADFTIGPVPSKFEDAVLSGGFAHAPMFFNFKVFQTIEQIDSVSLIVDGIKIDTKSSPPYSFEWVPDEAKDYAISGIVKDVVGNVSSTPTRTYSIQEFEGSGVSVEFNVPIPNQARVGSDLLLSAEAFSEYGVAEVEYFIDGVSVGTVYDLNSSVFSTVLNLKGYDQGSHFVSMVARDYKGNQSGVFDSSLTNIQERQRQELNLSPSADFGVPQITMNFPRNNMTISSTSTIRLVCTASDPDDSLVGVQYYLNGEPYGSEITYDKSISLDNFAFGTNWSPNGKTGTYYFSASARDSSGNVSFTPPVSLQVSQGNSKVPIVSLGPLSSSYETGDVISLTASVLDPADSNSGYGVIEEVRFFVNGSQIGPVDRQFPYVTNWTPPNSGTYEVHVQARDNEGNFAISAVSQTLIKDLEKVDLYLAPLKLTNNGIEDGLIDGSLQNINVSATGDPIALSELNRLTLYANGKVVGTATGTSLLLGTGLIDRIAYSFEWLVDYDRYADSSGSVQLIATGGNPLISSNLETVTVLSPVPWSNPTSAAGSILKDLTGQGASNEDIESFQEILNQNGGDEQNALTTWLGQVNTSSISQRIDLVAAHHVSLGKFHESLAALLEAESFINPNNDQWLKEYIDTLLNSLDYQAKFGQVPFLVGSSSRKSSIDFFQNRMDFVIQCYSNKYATNPSFQQVFQGANRMLEYWQNFEPNYWELLIGSEDNQIDSPPRRDALPVQGGNTGGGLLISNNFTYGGPVSGHCAVDLIFNMAKETTYEGNFPYIASSANNRDNVYKIVVYVYFLMRENASELSVAELSSFTNLPFEQAFEKILNDYRYTSRFNLVWKDSAILASGWKSEPWFGTFMDKYFPWIYHSNLGWLYISSGTQEYDKALNVGGLWTYSENLGWFWTYNEVFPWIYLEKEKGWAYLNINYQGGLSKSYYSTSQNSWVSF